MSFSVLILFALAIGVALILPVVGVWLAIQLVRGMTWLASSVALAIGMVFRFVGAVITDSARAVGHLVTGVFTLPLMLANVALLRFRAVGHYFRALEDAFYGLIICVYRVAIGHPLRLIGLGALTESIEVSAPTLFAEEPRTAPAVPKVRSKGASNDPARFDGYKIEEELRAGGSGARLFLAHPTRAKVNELAARGVEIPGQVVIKAFDRRFGSTVPQIVRESRALEAARGLGLVVEHLTTEDAFHYVMPFVPGHDLDVETKRLHEHSTDEGLGRDELDLVLGYARDLCHHLTRFHDGGLWHKDVKPSNLLVSEGRLRVVDFGLVTPLESALTLTTHGTEFFRDPELVRLALAGKRVQDVDGVKFDLYSAGAVLYSMVENSFPAHGSLSSISKAAPEGLRWIVRRSMADVDKRYATAHEMLLDVEALQTAQDPYKMPLGALPSVSGDTPSPAAASAPGQGADAGGLPAQRAATEPAGSDVRRFKALGFTAEITGLGAASRKLTGVRETLAEKRASLASKRQSAHDQRREEAQARAEARSEARDARRLRRRGALRGFATIAVMAAIVAGLMTASDSGPRWGGVAADNEGLADAVDAAASDAARVSVGRAGSMMTLPEEHRVTAGSRILLFTDPDDLSLTSPAMAYAESLEADDIVPLGTSVEDAEGIALLSNARYTMETAGPSARVQRNALQNLIVETQGLDGIHCLERDEQGRLTVLLLNGDHALSALLLPDPQPAPAPLPGPETPPAPVAAKIGVTVPR